MIAYRPFVPDVDGKITLAHGTKMLAPRGIVCRTGLMDNWYATTAQFKWLLAGKIFYCPLKSNRPDDDSGGQQPYQPGGCLNWSNAEVEGGKTLKEKGMPRTAKRNFSAYWCPPTERTTS